MPALWLATLIGLAWPASAGEADVEAVEVTLQTDGAYSFDVTIRHDDEGWSHYADRFEVLDASGAVLGTRTLFHPHVDEQPFTRSLAVAIPDGIESVVVRAHDLVHGIGGREMTVALPAR
ncbi:MAG: hypothetical protein KKD02_09370 [Alphaproteobacteria bacterium]|nr:hypothetical protein [Alphaproteobacteria bacterium]